MVLWHQQKSNGSKEPKNKGLKKEILANISFLNDILGIGYQDSYNYFQFGIEPQTKEKIGSLIIQRNEAKKEKNFALSDRLRDAILAFGVNLMDTPQGTFWEKV